VVLHLPPKCNPYPSDIQSLEICCDVPVLFGADLYGACEHFCSQNEKEKDDPDCPLRCLFKNNNIMRKEVINKTAMEEFFSLHGFGDPHWVPITKHGLEICELVYDKTKSFKEAFEKFEDCMNTNYEEHCVQFKEPAECDKVEDFMMKCQNVQYNCTVWPKYIIKIPEPCCNGKPDLFSAEWLTKGNANCNKQELLSKAAKMQCLATFLLKTTEIRTPEKWNFEIAAKFLTENSKDSAKWKAAIEKTMEICEKQVQGEVFAVIFEQLNNNLTNRLAFRGRGSQARSFLR
jgi:hypothetical protein